MRDNYRAVLTQIAKSSSPRSAVLNTWVKPSGTRSTGSALAKGVLLVASCTAFAGPMDMSGKDVSSTFTGCRPPRLFEEQNTLADALIERINSATCDPDLEDEGGPPPGKVIHEVSRYVRNAYSDLHFSPPSPSISCFFGEINVTWRLEERIVRLACFPKRSPILHFGETIGVPGSYRTVSNPTPESLASKLQWLVRSESLVELDEETATEV